MSWLLFLSLPLSFVSLGLALWSYALSKRAERTTKELMQEVEREMEAERRADTFRSELRRDVELARTLGQLGLREPLARGRSKIGLG